jgi:hypothetical protein
MRFAFTDDQVAFRDAVRELFDNECTPAHCVAERHLIIGEGEAHRQRLGSPRTRSAITLR